ncbi:PocR ligand-binding domain-containing protein [Eubacteriaceae bacterium ES2]|nr:PocR ligand-binding domain-containing protein [Eubacteriaceae bacterium ES2]
MKRKAIGGMNRLEDVIDLQKFGEFQDDMAQATGLAIITVDYKGQPVTHHSGCSDFCSMIRSNKHLGEYCQKCDSRGGLEAARSGKPFIYRCHMGIVDLAVPIIIEDQYLGAFMAGQILTDEDQLKKMARLGFSGIDIKDNDQYFESYHDLQLMPFHKFNAIARIIHYMNNQIINQKSNRITGKDKRLRLLSRTQRIKATSDRARTDFRFRDSAEAKMAESHESIDTGAKEFNAEIKNVYSNLSQSRSFNKILEPALTYIEKNYQENITLQKVAEIANVSSYYFSRLFKKELGVNFSIYLKQRKIAKGKELLIKTSFPIENIATKLGYYEAGYFTKVFKQSEGMTPSEYRKGVRMNNLNNVKSARN